MGSLKILSHRYSLTKPASKMFSLNKAVRLIAHKLYYHIIISLRSYLVQNVQTGRQRYLRKIRHVKQIIQINGSKDLKK